MNIRSITYFDNPKDPIDDAVLKRAGRFIHRARLAFEEAGVEVQTARFATPPFPTFLPTLELDSVVPYAKELEKKVEERGYAYLALGPALPAHPESYSLIPGVIEATDNVFLSASLTEPARGVSLPAVGACGEIIHALSPLEPNGFANLYFAALGNVPAGAPFFPAAYHDSGSPSFALAIEGADLAVTAFQNASDLREAQMNLIHSLESHSDDLSRQAFRLEEDFGVKFKGIDYSLAPFPGEECSLGKALELLGVHPLGGHGSTAAASFLADIIDRAKFPRAGFSGLMLPVLEDTILATRAEDGHLTVKDLLLYSAVCGTGLDTIPLPGNLSPGEISAVLLDLAALSLRLDKPLTARLMPIPGKKAGDPTAFDFPYFANSRIMDLDSHELKGLWESGNHLDLKPRSKDQS